MSTLKVQEIQHTGGTTAQTIDSSGRILTPARPAFSVKRINSGGGTDLSGHITFDTVTVNVGSCWDGTNKFQAPIAGVYFFSFVGFTCSSGGNAQADTTAIKAYIEQDTDSSFGSPSMVASTYTYINGTAGFFNVACSGVASLVANEYVRVNIGTGHIYTSTLASHYPPIFSGFLIG